MGKAYTLDYFEVYAFCLTRIQFLKIYEKFYQQFFFALVMEEVGI